MKAGKVQEAPEKPKPLRRICAVWCGEDWGGARGAKTAREGRCGEGRRKRYSPINGNGGILGACGW